MANDLLSTLGSVLSSPQTVELIRQAATALFSDHPNFGEKAIDQYRSQGLDVHPQNANWLSIVEGLVPAAAQTIQFLTQGDKVIPKGFVTMEALEVLQKAFPNVDLSQLHVTLSGGDSPAPPPQPLPSHLPPAADRVDLRPYCTPVSNQKQTSRCSAFAWTHALELAHNVVQKPCPRLSPTFTMLQFERMQGEFKDFSYAWKGGTGTHRGPEPGRLLVEHGTCRQELWPDDSPKPAAGEADMTADARPFAIPATVQTIHIDEVKKALTANCPVHVSMTTGPKFAELGRDGVLDAAEAPSGKHGWHAMLVVGYLDDHYIIKNSWGTDWGDKGYFYAPRKILEDAQADFTALLLHHEETAAAAPAPQGRAAEAAPAPPVAPTPPVPILTCSQCKAQVPTGKFCLKCGAELEKFCPQCGHKLPAPARFCPDCGGAMP